MLCTVCHAPIPEERQKRYPAAKTCGEVDCSLELRRRAVRKGMRRYRQRRRTSR